MKRRLVELRGREQGEHFKILAVKIFMDGVLEGGTAFLEEPYLHNPGSRGILNWEPQKFNQMCIALDRFGFQIHVHSIGDAATRITLDGFAEARRRNDQRDSRHSITHLQLVNTEDIDRFADLNVVAVSQPYWFVMDENYDQAVSYIGPERAAQQYPMKSFFEKDVKVASASDYNVTLHPNPLVAIETGVTRMALADACTPDAPSFSTYPCCLTKPDLQIILLDEQRIEKSKNLLAIKRLMSLAALELFDLSFSD